MPQCSTDAVARHASFTQIIFTRRYNRNLFCLETRLVPAGLLCHQCDLGPLAPPLLRCVHEHQLDRGSRCNPAFQ